MLKKLKPVIESGPFIIFLSWMVRLYSRTFRITLINEAAWIDYLENGGSVLLCTWHQQFFSMISYSAKYIKYRPSIMISRSSDGSIIASVARRIGWNTVRGSSSRGGFTALRSMIKELRKSKLAMHIADGPTGPAGNIKAGVIQLAHAAGAAIVPYYTSADRAWYFNSWDRYFVPKPFAKVTISFGDIMKLEKAKTPDEYEHQRLHLQMVMEPKLIDPDNK